MPKTQRLLAVLMVVVVALLPLAASASGPKVPFSATGTVETVDEGNVSPAGGSGRFVVKHRTVTGTFGGPDIVGPYTFVFGTNVPLATQAGRLHGMLTATLTAGEREANVVGSSAVTGGPFIAVLPGPVFVPAVSIGIDGKLTFTKGSQGTGAVSAVAWLVLTPDGHILGILPAGVPLLDLGSNPVGFSGPSTVTVSGTWSP